MSFSIHYNHLQLNPRYIRSYYLFTCNFSVFHFLGIFIFPVYSIVAHILAGIPWISFRWFDSVFISNGNLIHFSRTTLIQFSAWYTVHKSCKMNGDKGIINFKLVFWKRQTICGIFQFSFGLFDRPNFSWLRFHTKFIH